MHGGSLSVIVRHCRFGWEQWYPPLYSQMIRKAIFVLYRVAQTLALPAILIYLLMRGLRNRRYFHTLGQRFGDIPASWQRTVPGAIWLHAVSVGEVAAAAPLVEELVRCWPAAPVYISVGTVA